jgi:hypothetical protein
LLTQILPDALEQRPGSGDYLIIFTDTVDASDLTL